MDAEPDQTVQILRASAGEHRACRMLLPDFMAIDPEARLYVARLGTSGRVVAAAALSLQKKLILHQAAAMDLHVIPPMRRKGIGRALVERLSVEAAQAGAPGLLLLQWLEPDSPTASAMQAMGFVPVQQRFEFEGKIADALPALASLYQEVVERGWIPSAAKIVPLSQVDIQAVAELHMQHLGGTREELMRSLRGGPPGYYDAASFVLLLEGRVAGFTLGRLVWEQKLCEVDSTVVEPSLRLGWANLWLRYHAGKTLLAGGIETIRYRALDVHADTLRVFRRGRTRLVRTTALFRKPI